MFWERPLASMLHLFVVFAFVNAGVFFLAAHFVPKGGEVLINFLLYEEGWLKIGSALLLTGFLLWGGFHMLQRGSYLVLRMGVVVDQKILRQAVEESFSKMESKTILHRLETMKNKELKLTVSTKEENLSDVEKALTTLLRERFGYTGQFTLHLKMRA